MTAFSPKLEIDQARGLNAGVSPVPSVNPFRNATVAVNGRCTRNSAGGHSDCELVDVNDCRDRVRPGQYESPGRDHITEGNLVPDHQIMRCDREGVCGGLVDEPLERCRRA